MKVKLFFAVLIIFIKTTGNYSVALKEAIEQFGCPEIFNYDKGSQFTSEAFTANLKDHGIRISMQGRGRLLDNVLVVAG